MRLDVSKISESAMIEIVGTVKAVYDLTERRSETC